MGKNNVQKGALAQLREDVDKLTVGQNKLSAYVMNHVTTTLKWHGWGIWLTLALTGLTLALIAVVLVLVVQGL